MTAGDFDKSVRVRAFGFLREAIARHGELLERDLLESGFVIDGRRVPLLGPQGIWKPAILPEIPLSVTTSPDSPYDDAVSEDRILYSYRRQGGPAHRDNEGLRAAMRTQTPLVYFVGLRPGAYRPFFPAFIVGDDPVARCFHLAVDESAAAGRACDGELDPVSAARRAYITRQVRQRLHQDRFRESVLRAYRVQCAVCALRHRELLDAAHIIPDRDPRGEPVVPNGLALCKLHHAAFDDNLLGVRPDLVIEVRRDILDESDGPMLVHGLQGFHDKGLRVVPRAEALRPGREFLERRYDLFRKAG